MDGYIDLAEYQPQSSHPDKKKRQNGFCDLEFLQNQHIVKIFCLKKMSLSLSNIYLRDVKIYVV